MKNLLILLICLIVHTNSQSEKYVIIGAGPVGLFLANQLLESHPNSEIRLYENRKFIRLQCIRLPFAIAKKFPLEVRQVLWPVQTIREMLFKNQSKSDPNLFWPKLGYHHFPRISVGNLQNTFKEYLEKKYATRFNFIQMAADLEMIQNLYRNEASVIFFTAGFGNLNQLVREKLGIQKMKYDFMSKPLDGFYLIYNNINEANLHKIDEFYMRDNKYMNRIDLSNNGITYSASNNANRNVQLYTYPVNTLVPFYKTMPESIKKTASFPSGINYKHGHTTKEHNYSDLTDEMIKENEWLDSLRPVLDEIFNRFKIYIPDHANLHYARRMQYAFEKTFGFNQHNIPVVFVGDSMGGTDYKYGLNLGRGLYCADKLVSYLKNSAFENYEMGMINYQNYWDRVLEKEFGFPDKDLIADNEIFYKYVVMGRTVDGKEYGEDDYEAFAESSRVQYGLRKEFLELLE